MENIVLSGKMMDCEIELSSVRKLFKTDLYSLIHIVPVTNHKLDADSF
jgi:hypothetical protein